MTDDVTLDTKFALEEMFRVDERLSPDYEQGWNAAIAHAIEKFGGPNHLFHENEELGYKLDDAERRLAVAIEALKHYADDDNWDDPHPDLRYGPDTLYNFNCEFNGEIPGYFVACEALAQIRGVGDKE